MLFECLFGQQVIGDQRCQAIGIELPEKMYFGVDVAVGTLFIVRSRLKSSMFLLQATCAFMPVAVLTPPPYTPPVAAIPLSVCPA